ncbi:ureidoglycolate lyase [Amphritea pacifica]|uniref:Ureidoglycolate lyase n=1 Tax=Amphritea pacifica TaxID=2811233 RepID=A0ABS2W3P6_9GAMM|nr:ureidoglycolate lyase [Amphritea pacifica]MBN0986327.1 ureidoglycolate lyase [Amphritea pacifica]MBN1007020.1 ureidoglycolate lyase [Amphritea pacifica]
MLSVLKVEPLTKAAFKPFGDVIETEGSRHFLINNGSTERFHRLADVDVSAAQGEPIISIFRAQPLPMPFTVKMMERHPLGSQAFISRGEEPFLVLVAPPGDSVNGDQLRLFLTNGRQGVNYSRGVWHHPVLALKPDQEFIIIDRAGEGNNCDEIYFDSGHQTVVEI